MDTLYIFLDESGNFDFSLTGTKHLVMCAYSTTEPQQHTLDLQMLKYQILAQGYEQECFHATEDRQFVRDEVYKIIKQSRNSTYDIVYLEKNKTHPLKQNKKVLYTLIVGALLTYIFGRIQRSNQQIDQIIIVVDQALTNKEQGYLKSLIKPRLKSTGMPYKLYFFQTKSDPNGQIADYGAWGKYVSLERNELRPIRQIQHLISNDFDVFRRGTRRYY